MEKFSGYSVKCDALTSHLGSGNMLVVATFSQNIGAFEAIEKLVDVWKV